MDRDISRDLFCFPFVYVTKLFAVTTTSQKDRWFLERKRLIHFEDFFSRFSFFHLSQFRRSFSLHGVSIYNKTEYEKIEDWPTTWHFCVFPFPLVGIKEIKLLSLKKREIGFSDLVWICADFFFFFEWLRLFFEVFFQIMIMSYRLYVYINYYYYLFFLDDGMLFLKNKYYFKNKKTKGI